MKILLFIRSLDVGGAQRQLTLLARGLAQRGHDVAVAVLYSGTATERMLATAGVRIIPLDKRGRWDVSPLWRLWRLFRAERADVVYAFLTTQTTLAALLVPRATSRLVFGVRSAAMELDNYDTLSGLTFRLEALLSRRVDLIIVNAQAGIADAVARGLPPDRIAVVANGIDTEAMRPDLEAGHAQRAAWGIDDRAFVIGMVARLDPMKDHRNFIAAAATFQHLYPDVRFVCIGDGPATYRRELAALAQSHGLADRLLWAGEATDLRAVYGALDMATLSSAYGEAFPNVIGEAMACGVPVVATAVGDSAAIIGECGEVVPPRQPEALSAAWMRLRKRLERDGERLKGDVRSRIATHFDVNAMVTRSERLLAALCAGQPLATIGAPDR
jgi:glycosyltransferase involved in cell wall biosynthesis